MKQYSISILKEEWAKYRGLSLQRIMEKHVFPRENMYAVQVVQEIPYDIQCPQELIEKTVRPWAERKMFRNINGIVLEINENGKAIAYYLEESGTIVLPDYYMAPDDLIAMDSKGIHVPGFSNESWYPIDCINLDGEQVFILDSERFPNTHEYIIVNGKIQMIMETMLCGFSDLLIGQIREKSLERHKTMVQTIAMANGYGRIKDKGKSNTKCVETIDNYDSLSLREKMQLNRVIKQQ